MEIRPAFSHEELIACADIWLAASIRGHDFIPQEFWEQNRQAMLEQYLPVSVVNIAYLENIPVAFSATCKDTLSALFTLPDYWGRGAGRSLLNHLSLIHKKLRLTVYVKNRQAIAFYTKYGFKEIAQQVCIRTKEPELVMEWKRTT